MLKGRVNRHGGPVVSIQLILRDRLIKFTAVIDNGFNGYLSAPRRLLTGSKWLTIGTEKFEFATGSVVEQEIFLGEINFDGKRGPVYSVATEGQDILIETKLLRDKSLVVNFRTHRVTVK